MPPAFWSRLWPRKRRPTRSSPALPRARSTSEPCVSRAAQELHNAGANQVTQAAARGAAAQPIATRQQARAEIRSLRSHSNAELRSASRLGAKSGRPAPQAGRSTNASAQLANFLTHNRPPRQRCSWNRPRNQRTRLIVAPNSQHSSSWNGVKIMQRSNLLLGTAIALVMCAVPAMAQQKSEEKSGATQTQGSESKEQGTSQKRTEQKTMPKEGREQGAAQGEGKEKGAQTKEKSGKGTAQAPAKEHEKKGSAQTESPQKTGKGTAQSTDKEPQGKERGTAQAPGKEQDKTGTKTGQGQAQSKDRGAKENAEKQSKDREGQKSTARPSPGERTQLSEQQRSTLHQTILKERNVNRASNVNISVSVGTRIPRSVRLAAIPASVLSLAPAYRSYRYVVVHDQILIVDPNTYEIVEIVAEPGHTARADSRGGQVTLSLTEEEKAIVLRSVEMDHGSTLALGNLTEGSTVPRGAQVHSFPDRVVQQVPKLKGHKFVAAENRVAIVDPQSDKVQLVLEGKH